jgi:hypothetical protein
MLDDFFSSLGSSFEDELKKKMEQGWMGDIAHPERFLANNLIGGTAINNALGIGAPAPVAPTAPTAPTAGTPQPQAPQPIAPPQQALPTFAQPQPTAPMTIGTAPQQLPTMAQGNVPQPQIPVAPQQAPTTQTAAPVAPTAPPVPKTNEDWNWPSVESPGGKEAIQKGMEERRLAQQQAQEASRTPPVNTEQPAPAGPVAPTTAAPPQAAAPVAPTGGNVPTTQQPPAAPYAGPGETYNALTARNESGGNPSIGYHYAPDENGVRKSTAYGKYGITAGTYADIQQADPYFANKPITSLTEADQDRANTVLANNNAKVLTAAGVPVNDNTLNAAHLLGAQGLVDYMKTGQLRPDAAAANGGEEKLGRLVQERLQGNFAPASFAGHKYEDQITNAASQGPQALMELSNNKDIPAAYRRQAAELATVKIQAQQKKQDVEETILNGIKNGTLSTDLANEQKKQQGGVGDLIAGVIYGALGQKEMSQKHFAKFDPILSASTQSFGGQQYSVYKDPFGNITNAFDANGMKVKPNVLSQLQANPVAPDIKDTWTDNKGKAVMETKDGKFINQDGSLYTGSFNNLTKVGSADPVVQQALLNARHTEEDMRKKGLYYSEEDNDKAKKKSFNDYFQMMGRTPPSAMPSDTTTQPGQGAVAPQDAGAAIGEAKPTTTAGTGTNVPPGAAVDSATGKVKDVAFYMEHPELPRKERVIPESPQYPGVKMTIESPEQFQKRQESLSSGNQSLAQDIANYNVQATSSMFKSNPYLEEQVKKFNPKYNMAFYDQSKRAQTAFATGPQGNTVRSLNVALDHMETGDKLIDNLNNVGLPAFNWIANKWGEQTGSTAPTNFNAAKEVIGDEVVKAVLGTGAGSSEDRKAIKLAFSNSRTPEQLKGVLNTYRSLLYGQLDGLERQYKDATKLDNFTDKLSPAALEVRNNALQGKIAPAAKTSVSGKPLPPSKNSQLYNDADSIIGR